MPRHGYPWTAREVGPGRVQVGFRTPEGGWHWESECGTIAEAKDRAGYLDAGCTPYLINHEAESCPKTTTPRNPPGGS